MKRPERMPKHDPKAIWKRFKNAMWLGQCDGFFGPAKAFLREWWVMMKEANNG